MVPTIYALKPASPLPDQVLIVFHLNFLGKHDGKAHFLHVKSCIQCKIAERAIAKFRKQTYPLDFTNIFTIQVP